MFGLKIIRHRIFESNFHLPLLTPTCNHERVYDPWHGAPGERSAKQLKEAMGIDWMPMGGGRRKGTITEAIPPAYTEFIGRRILEAAALERSRNV
jgi:hypothetical protein